MPDTEKSFTSQRKSPQMLKKIHTVWFGERIIRKRISENFRIFCCVFEAPLTQYIPDNFSFIFFQNCRAGAQYFVSKPTGLKGLPYLITFCYYFINTTCGMILSFIKSMIYFLHCFTTTAKAAFLSGETLLLYIE
jgi:hypothetical protein